MGGVGKKLVDFRTSKGLSQEKLANLAGVCLRTVQRIEKDEVQPHGQTLSMICDALGVSISELESTEAKEGQWQVLGVLNMASLLVLILPGLHILFMFLYWRRSKLDDRFNELARKIVSIQIYWLLFVIISFLLIHGGSILLTGQSSYGKFPVRSLVYLLSVCVNLLFVFMSGLEISKRKVKLLERLRPIF